MTPVKVKICGITNTADALTAAEAGADALGFIFYESSPRCVTPKRVGEMIRELPPFVARVGVFVNPSEQEVRRALEECRLDTLQFHGEEPPEFCRQFGFPVIKAFRIRDAKSLEALGAYPTEAWLLDTYATEKRGGTGESFDWALAVTAVKRGGRVLLAGGLTPENAADAARRVRPYALDVSSGVESAPGKKDPAKVRAFVLAAKRT